MTEIGSSAIITHVWASSCIIIMAAHALRAFSAFSWILTTPPVCSLLGLHPQRALLVSILALRASDDAELLCLPNRELGPGAFRHTMGVLCCLNVSAEAEKRWY